MELLTVKEAGKLWGITARMATFYCERGRVPGAFKKGNLWLIPGDAKKPDDRRKNRQTAVKTVKPKRQNDEVKPWELR